MPGDYSFTVKGDLGEWRGKRVEYRVDAKPDSDTAKLLTSMKKTVADAAEKLIENIDELRKAAEDITIVEYDIERDGVKRRVIWGRASADPLGQILSRYYESARDVLSFDPSTYPNPRDALNAFLQLYSAYIGAVSSLNKSIIGHTGQLLKVGDKSYVVLRDGIGRNASRRIDELKSHGFYAVVFEVGIGKTLKMLKHVDFSTGNVTYEKLVGVTPSNSVENAILEYASKLYYTLLSKLASVLGGGTSIWYPLYVTFKDRIGKPGSEWLEALVALTFDPSGVKDALTLYLSLAKGRPLHGPWEQQARSQWGFAPAVMVYAVPLSSDAEERLSAITWAVAAAENKHFVGIKLKVKGMKESEAYESLTTKMRDMLISVFCNGVSDCETRVDAAAKLLTSMFCKNGVCTPALSFAACSQLSFTMEAGKTTIDADDVVKALEIHGFEDAAKAIHGLGSMLAKARWGVDTSDLKRLVLEALVYGVVAPYLLSRLEEKLKDAVSRGDKKCIENIASAPLECCGSYVIPGVTDDCTIDYTVEVVIPKSMVGKLVKLFNKMASSTNAKIRTVSINFEKDGLTSLFARAANEIAKLPSRVSELESEIRSAVENSVAAPAAAR